MQLFLLLLTFVIPSLASIAFEENKGQVPTEVKFWTGAAAAPIAFESDAVAFHSGADTIRLRFPGASPLTWKGEDPTAQRYYYVPGSANAASAPEVRRFARIRAKNVYPGIDLLFYGKDGRLEYDFIVQPEADPTQIRLAIESPTPVRAGPSGDLRTGEGPSAWRQLPPSVYQRAGRVDASFYRSHDAEFRLKLGPYDSSRPLIVDPILEFSTFVGGAGDEEVTVVGDGFLAGHTTSPYFPSSQFVKRQGRDIFLRLVSTPRVVNSGAWADRVYIFGGSGDDTISGLSISYGSNSGSISMGGTTSSPDLFFTVPRDDSYPLQTYGGGASDAFLASVSIRLDSPSYFAANSRIFIGGSGADRMTAYSGSGFNILFAGVTDSPDLPVRNASQSSLAGGLDAFFGYAPNYYRAESDILSYFGGTGDDTPLTVRNFALGILLAGQSTSPDLPQTPGNLSGPSDAFLVAIGPIFPSNTNLIPQPSILQAFRYGGSGDDRITASGTTTDAFLLFGETDSPDFPADSTPRGGLDVFTLKIHSTELSLQSTARWGGSGDERVNGANSSLISDYLLVGSTTSADLPLKDPQQAALAGASDAYFAILGPNHELRAASYFGGAQNDSAVGVLFQSPTNAANGPIRIAGTSSSSDLPLLFPWQPSLAGASDGFLADIAIPLLSAQSTAWAAQGYPTYVQLRATQSLANVPVNVSVGDPSIVRLRTSSGLADRLTIVSAPGASIEAVAPEGETTLTFSAEGFSPVTVRLRVGRAVLSPLGLPARLSHFAADTPLNSQVLIIDPATQAPVPNLVYSSLGLAITQWTSSRPEVISVVPVLSGGTSVFRMSPQSRGTAFLKAESSLPFWPPEGAPVEVVQPSLLEQQSAARATELFGGGLSPVWGDTTNSAVRIRGRYRVESEDPSRLLVYFANVSPPTDPAASSETEIPESSPQNGLGIGLKALASSGSVRVKISSPELSNEVWYTVDLKRVFFRPSFVYANTDLTAGAHLGPSEDLYLGSRFYIEGQAAFYSSNPPSGSDLSFLIESSTPDVVALPSPNWVPTSSTFSVRTRTPGVTTLRFRPQGADAAKVVSDTAYRLEVSNNPPLSLSLPPIVVGKDLMTGHSISVRSQVAVDIQLRVEDPSLALLSDNPRNPGTASLTLRANSSGASFYVHGLAASGVTNLRVSIPGRTEISTTITLVPSGFAFSRDFFSVAYYQNLPSISVSSYALDPETLAPMSWMSLRPGVSARVTLQSDSQNFTPSVASCSFAALGSEFCGSAFSWSAPGEFEVTLQAPEGFTAPRFSGSLRVRVSRSKLNGGFTYAVKDALVWSVLQAEGARPSRITLTSADPSLVLVSTDPKSPGTPSATAAGGSNFYLHGLASQGTARLRATADNADPAEFIVQMQDRKIIFTSANVFTQMRTPQTVIQGSPQTYYAVLVSEGDLSTIGARPGVDPLSFNVENSNPNAMQIEGTTAFVPGSNGVQLKVSALAAGEADIALALPGARSLPVRFTARGPRVQPLTAILAYNMRDVLPLSLELGAAGPADSAVATVRSLDPSKVLVSRTQQGAAAASASVVWPAFTRNNVPVYVEALASEGYADLEVNLPGHDPALVRVHLTPNALRLWDSSGSSVNGNLTATVGQTLNLDARFTSIPRPDLANPLNPPLSLYGNLRPGAEPLAVSLEISDPAVVALRSPIQPITSQGTSIQLRASGAGRATVKLATPPGFVERPFAESSRDIRVTLPFVTSSCNQSILLAFESVWLCTLTSSVLESKVTLTARSDSASTLLLAATETAVGAPQVDIPANGVFFLHGLARSGATRLTLSGNGFADTFITVNHGNSAFFLDGAASGYGIGPLGLSGSSNTWITTVSFCGVNTGGGPQNCQLQLRPGALPVSIPLRLDDPTIVSATPNPLVFQPGDRTKQITLRGLKAGSTLLEVGTPAGFYTPAVNSAIVRVNP